ncbi:hypothetical protein KZ810_12390 [Sphingomonas sp. RHCKR47]|uniref:hypothetical protein n=1 Tax=Sphingomonas citricola TaxID=2862498 RepID=UPI001CA4A683|nr:hypothetical protein [Sphingomonas citricola]MBW6524299.1 hypothetical protein [Sphingomonas citricola]
MREMIVAGLALLAAGCGQPADTGLANARDAAAARVTPDSAALVETASTDRTPAAVPTSRTDDSGVPADKGTAPAPAPGDAAPKPSPTATARADRDGPAPTRSAMRDCYLKVDGVVQVSGRCRVFPMGKDQYTLNTWDGGKPAQPHFAVVTKNSDADTTATATWNADPADDHAMDPLGIVARDGDCWVNKRALICVR